MRDLKIFLLKEGTANDPSVLFDNAVEQINISDIGTLYYKPSFFGKAKWLSLFGTHIPNEKEKDFMNSSSRAALIVPVSDRLFVLSFGYGRYLLKDGIWDPRFGIKTTLNLIESDSLRSIDKTTLGSVPLHSREQLSRSGSARDFGINFDEDIVRAVTGKSKVPELGMRVSGSDVLAVSVECELEDVPNLLKSYLEYSQKKDYQKEFSWIDQVQELTDKTIIEKLNDALVEKIKVGDTDNIWLAVPGIIDWFGVGGFKYTGKDKEALHDDLDLGDFLGTIRDKNALDINLLRQRRIYFYRSENEAIPVKWSVLKCLYAEIDLDGQKYILTDQSWYQISRSFVDEIESACGSIPECRIAFPDYIVTTHGVVGSNEGELGYNKEVVNVDTSSRTLFDRKNISYQGITSIEFCDIYTNIKQLIHVKRYGGSSSLSHLFQQGTVSAELFAGESRFRQEVNKILPTTERVNVDEIDPRAYEIAFLVINKSDKQLKLPFFSKVTLRGAIRRLRAYGYKVSFSRVKSI